ncbi:hypothetical protein R1sor_027550 [Riccia sorocarpa]|uniref:tRNA (guanosine(18)-2'-O)-methyltransferase TARBP1 n=1 Tax=Riccia sorocarpa TaxID=122646 RepID=A0ABD3GHE3_9MARC
MGSPSALLGALRNVSASAVAGLFDALLLTMQCSSSSLLLDILRLFPEVFQESAGDSSSTRLSEDGEGIHTYLTALFYLLKRSGREEEGNLENVIWTACVPLLRCQQTKFRPLQVEVAEMLAQAAAEHSNWAAVGNSIAPLCLESLNPQFLLNDNSASDQRVRVVTKPAWRMLEKKHNVAPLVTTLDERPELLSASTVCQLLGTLLSGALDSLADKIDTGKSAGVGTYSAGKFCEETVSVFLAPALAMFSQPVDSSLRHCAVQSLLPSLLTCSIKCGWSSDAFSLARADEARMSSLQEVWRCCQALLSHGPSQRQDVYMALASFSDLLFPAVLPPLPAEIEVDESDGEGVHVFDIRNDVLFWEELKSGLADADSLTRKRALFILRKALPGIQRSDAGSSTDADRIQTESNTSGISMNRTGNQNSSKRSKWAEKEAGFLGVGAVRDKLTEVHGWRQRWDAFILLHETLEEYGIHLVEAAWSHQMSFLLQFTKPKGDAKDAGPYWGGSLLQKKACNIDVNFTWISVLWQRGFDHKNPQVRRLVMQSFLEVEWERIRRLSSLLPDNVVLGPFLEALDDPVHHKDFGMKGIYSSVTAEGAAKFIGTYSSSLASRRRGVFVVRLAKAIVAKNRGRSGLMAQAICLEAAALASGSVTNRSSENTSQASDMWNEQSYEGPASLLDLLKNLVDNCKNHFNPNYRAKVCGHLLGTACALVAVPKVPFVKFAAFLTSFPKEQITYGGSLHHLLMSWIQAPVSASESGSASEINSWIVDGLRKMAETFLKLPGFLASVVTDEDVEAWRLEADRWTRLLALGLVNGGDCQHLISLIQSYACQIYRHAYMSACTPERLLLLLRSIFKEFKPSIDFLRSADIEDNSDSRSRSLRPGDKRITNVVLSIMDEIKSYAGRSVSAFWEYEQTESSELPAAVKGKLGGPSQRRLPSPLTAAVLQGILSMSTLAECCLWCCEVGRLSDIQESVVSYLWKFAWEVVTIPRKTSQIGAELQLAALEAFTYVCSALAKTATPFHVSAAHAWIKLDRKARPHLPDAPGEMADGLLNALFSNVEDSAFINALGRSRRSTLYGSKWCSADTLLSISGQCLSSPETFGEDENRSSAFSNSTLVRIFKDCIESLESAGEEYFLPLLRSIRRLMRLEVIEKMAADDEHDKYQIMWTLVQSGWSAVVDSNKRRVAPTAAFLSAIFHPAVFGDLEMHGSREDQEECGPLKWLLNRLIELGSRSPRTMRLTALHITGLWLSFPETATCYMKELKQLTLYGGESVDEELDGEILESESAAREYATLIQSSDPELTEEFTNSEMYVRVTVAVMVHTLATQIENLKPNAVGAKSVTTQDGWNFGRAFLLGLLTAAAEDTDLNKELYKKKSAIHRRKVRVWQMLCILSPFLCREDIAQLMHLLKKCLHRNNMPSVRQYIETFAAQLFLRFPELIEENLISALHDYNMKTQALSSYVLIAANVVFGTAASRREELMKKVLPAILPFMTSHHHNLRSFTQVLIYRILSQFPLSVGAGKASQEGVQCLQSITDYLDGNADCSRMRVFVEKHLNTFDPVTSTTPRGVFGSRYGEVDTAKSAEDHPFECAPVAVLDQVASFLSEAREELRESMAADAMALSAEENKCTKGGKENGGKPERVENDPHGGTELVTAKEAEDLAPLNFDIQKKIASLRFSDSHTGETRITTSRMSEYDTESELLLESMESRAKELIRMRGGRQDLVVVASLVGSVPNLAGLARTCEVFKASTLVVADVSVAEDRQFQLISVTAEQWIPLLEVPEVGISSYLKRKRREGYSILGLEQTANSVSIEKYLFPEKVVLVLGRESDGIPVDIIHALDTCLEIPQLGVIRSLNVHVSGAIAVWEYTRQQLSRSSL